MVRIVLRLLPLCATLFVLGCGGPTECAVCDAAVAGDVETVKRVLAELQPDSARVAAADMAVYRMAAGYSMADGRARYPEVAALLFKAGAHPHQDRVYRTTGRSRAYIVEDLARFGDAPTVKAFIDAGFDVKGEPGAWALLAASQASSESVARLLVDAGADPNRGVLDTTATKEAQKANDAEMLAVLQRRP